MGFGLTKSSLYLKKNTARNNLFTFVAVCLILFLASSTK